MKGTRPCHSSQMRPLIFIVAIFLLSSSLLVIAKKDMAAPRTKWPDLVGQDGAAAEAAIKQERPELEVQIVPEDAMVSMDFRTDRVRIFVKADNKVAKAPNVG